MRATGRDLQLARQIGEHLVAAELGRRGFVATPFAGNVPMFDLLAADLAGRAIPIQVKTIRGAAWQFNVQSFLDIRFEGDRQFVDGTAKGTTPELLCIFVRLKGDGQADDEFYIFQLRNLQEILTKKYSVPGGRLRPINPKSTHCAVSPIELEKFRNNWPLVAALLSREGVFGARQSSKQGKPNKLNSVEVEGIRYRSTWAAWQALKIGDNGHQAFRRKLKSSESGELDYTDKVTGKAYRFRLIPFDATL